MSNWPACRRARLSSRPALDTSANEPHLASISTRPSLGRLTGLASLASLESLASLATLPIIRARRSESSAMIGLVCSAASRKTLATGRVVRLSAVWSQSQSQSPLLGDSTRLLNVPAATSLKADYTCLCVYISECRGLRSLGTSRLERRSSRRVRS